MANIEKIVQHPAFAIAGMGILTANTLLTIGIKSDTGKLMDKSNVIYNKVTSLETGMNKMEKDIKDVKILTNSIYGQVVPSQPTQQPAPVAPAPQPAQPVQQTAPQPAPVAPVAPAQQPGQPAQQNLVVVTGSGQQPEQAVSAQQTGQQPEQDPLVALTEQVTSLSNIVNTLVQNMNNTGEGDGNNKGDNTKQSKK